MSEETEQGFDQLFLQGPQSMSELVNEISSEIYSALKLAIEIGNWNDGVKLNSKQLEFCMQAIILYEAKNLPEHERTGFELTVDCKSIKLTAEEQVISVSE